MQAYNEDNLEVKEGFIQQTYGWVQSRIISWIGFIVLIIGVILVFVMASIEGTKEIKAPRGKSGEIMAEWRAENPTKEFPEQYTDVWIFNEKQYYFVIDSYVEKLEFVTDENGDIIYDDVGNPLTETVLIIDKWHWSYDGGIEYIIYEPKYYMVIGFTILVALIVGQLNYITSKQSAKKSKDYVKTANAFGKAKEDIMPFVDYMQHYCDYKNEEVYESAKKDKIIEAGLKYSQYQKMTKEERKKLDLWQKIKLWTIRFIRVKPIKPSDILYEKGRVSRKIQILPNDEATNSRKYFIQNIIRQFFSASMSGLVAGFGFVLGDYALGITAAGTVAMAWFFAIIAGNDEVRYTQRNRLIAKTTLCIEFKNVKDKIIAKVKLEEEEELKKAIELKNREEVVKQVEPQKEVVTQEEKKETNLVTVTQIA